MDQIAETYAKLTLAVGQHDPNYVDAFYGPPTWRAEIEVRPLPLAEIRDKATDARSGLERSETEPMLELRRKYLAKQLDAMIARVAMLSGEEFSFDEESAALYDAVAESRTDSEYGAVVRQLNELLPGEEPIADRFDRLKEEFFIPKEKLDAVFQAGAEAARCRTKDFIQLPAGEDFRLEYVTGEVWGAYNWYKGGGHSLIQVNTDFPIAIDRVVGLACHEGYPGHHVYNALLEQHLVRERKWMEFSVYALYSPQSLIAEGTAEYGVELTYSPEEKLAFEKEELYPLAGLDPQRAEEYARILDLTSQLANAGNDAGRRYLDGKATRQQTIDWLVEYTITKTARAEQRVRFIEAHRSYTVTYNVGKDLVKKYVESRASSKEEKWKVFTDLLSTPQVPSALR